MTVVATQQILTQGMVDNTKQVGMDPVITTSSWYDGEILAYYSAGTSNALKQATTNEAIIVGVAIGGSANILNTLLGSSDSVMGTISSSQGSYWRSIDVCPFEANLLNKTLAQSDIGTAYGITRTTVGSGVAALGVWTLDSTKTGTSVRAVPVGLQNTDGYHGGIGDTNARVICKFLASYSFWYASASGGEF